jgi:protein-tyrosine phosphatase
VDGILFVCTANQIRSVIAHRLTQEALRARFGPHAEAIAVSSAGTHALPGQPIWPQAAVELVRRGVAADGHRAQLLAPTMVRRSALVLTAARVHRDHVTGLWPPAVGRTFTLRELAWLLDGVDSADLPGHNLPERLENLTELASSRRWHVPPPAPADLDIADPVGGTDADFVRAAVEIEQALTASLNVL